MGLPPLLGWGWGCDRLALRLYARLAPTNTDRDTHGHPPKAGRTLVPAHPTTPRHATRAHHTTARCPARRPPKKQKRTLQDTTTYGELLETSRNGFQCKADRGYKARAGGEAGITGPCQRPAEGTSGVTEGADASRSRCCKTQIWVDQRSKSLGPDIYSTRPSFYRSVAAAATHLV